jgi:hypothetical protein
MKPWIKTLAAIVCGVVACAAHAQWPDIELAAFVRAETGKWATVVKTARIKLD